MGIEQGVRGGTPIKEEKKNPELWGEKVIARKHVGGGSRIMGGEKQIYWFVCKSAYSLQKTPQNSGLRKEGEKDPGRGGLFCKNKARESRAMAIPLG